jgi:hypothetical protein
MCSSKVDGDSSKVQNVLLPDPSGALVAAPGHLRQKRGFQVRPGNLAVPRRRGSIASAGIGVWAGSGGVGNSFNGLSIANNDVNTAFIGISIVGGYGFPGQTLSLPTTNNVVAHPQIFCNQLDQVATLGVAPSSEIKGINVVAGVDVADGNQVLALRLEDNIVAGVLNDASLFANLGTGASGNTISISKISVPGSCDPRISPMLWTTCRSTPPGRGGVNNALQSLKKGSAEAQEFDQLIGLWRAELELQKQAQSR